MVNDRVTVSLDDEARAALDSLVSTTGEGQSELVRRALTFYSANYQVANEATSADLEEYHTMLNSGEHVLLDIDFLHILLASVEKTDAELTDDIERVAEYHAQEYQNRFSNVGELLDWLSICGFLTVRESHENTYHVVFPSEDLKWFMTKFIDKSSDKLPFDLEFEEGVSKVLITEQAD